MPAGSLRHAVTCGKPLSYDKDNFIESVGELHSHLLSDGGDWGEIGLLLWRTFNYSTEVSIAATAAGTVPGHMRYAPLSYLQERKVNLVLGHPWMVPNRPADPHRYSLRTVGRYTKITAGDPIPADSMIVEIPINPERALAVLYLTRSTIVDDVMGRNGWNAYRLASLPR